MSRPEIETAFKEAWWQETQSSAIPPSVLHRSLHASGYCAGAEAKAESMAKTERDRWTPAMERFGKGERVKAFEEAINLLIRCTSMGRQVDGKLLHDELQKLKDAE